VVIFIFVVVGVCYRRRRKPKPSSDNTTHNPIWSSPVTEIQPIQPIQPVHKGMEIVTETLEVGTIIVENKRYENLDVVENDGVDVDDDVDVDAELEDKPTPDSVNGNPVANSDGLKVGNDTDEQYGGAVTLSLNNPVYEYSDVITEPDYNTTVPDSTDYGVVSELPPTPTTPATDNNPDYAEPEYGTNETDYVNTSNHNTTAPDSTDATNNPDYAEPEYGTNETDYVDTSNYNAAITETEYSTPADYDNTDYTELNYEEPSDYLKPVASPNYASPTLLPDPVRSEQPPDAEFPIEVITSSM